MSTLAQRFRGIVGLVGALAAFGCTEPKTAPAYMVTLRTYGDQGRPLPGTTVALAGREYGTSDPAGVIPISLSGSEGQVLDLRITCPEGYRSPSAPVSVVLKRVSESDRRPEYAAHCQPLLRTLVVAIRAERGPNLPVLYLGHEVARTDRSGAAHFMVKTPPEDSVELTLDTSQSPELRPRSPNTRLQVPPHDDLLLLDQSFSVVVRPKARKAPWSGIINIRGH